LRPDGKEMEPLWEPNPRRRPGRQTFVFKTLMPAGRPYGRMINVPLHDKYVFDTHIWWLRGAGTAKTAMIGVDRCRCYHG
jgi:hypothetical protein